MPRMRSTRGSRFLELLCVSPSASASSTDITTEGLAQGIELRSSIAFPIMVRVRLFFFPKSTVPKLAPQVGHAGTPSGTSSLQLGQSRFTDFASSALGECVHRGALRLPHTTVH